MNTNLIEDINNDELESIAYFKKCKKSKIY